DAFHYANLADPAFVSDREPLPQPQRGDDLHPVVSRYLEAIDRGDQTGWSFGGDQITYIVLQPTEGRLTVNEAAETLAAGDHGLMGDVTWSEPPEIDIAATEHGAAIIDPRGRLGTWSPPAHWSGRYWIVGWTFDHDLIFESSRNLQADWQGAIAPLANYAESMRQELEDQGWSDSFVDEDEPDPMILLPYAVALAIVELDSGIVLDAALEDAAETIAVPERMPQE
ncbi:MAG: hypothetical protein HOV86_22615, partial [Thermoactinospora sp.]|nr:hypothetical protein [Thermoactinospora sp.]